MHAGMAKRHGSHADSAIAVSQPPV